LYTESSNLPRTKKVRLVKSKVKSISTFSLTSSGLFTEFALAGLTVNSAYYFVDKRTGCCFMVTHRFTSLFTRDFTEHGLVDAFKK
jgi:hypothetical protein